ncbi:MAG: hypothetical protein GEV05_07070 [Betaproteobacteria bacterium]|nr:hypothetical protein [Betaproteobacteria bacterium]
MSWLVYVDSIPTWVCASMEQAAELAAPYAEDQRTLAIEQRTSSVSQTWLYDRPTQRWVVEE